MDLQLSMGFDGVPDVEMTVPERPPEVITVPRPHPTWVLLANRRGPCGFHHALYVAPYGCYVAICGAKGRRVYEEATEIVLCPECAAQRHEGPR